MPDFGKLQGLYTQVRNEEINYWAGLCGTLDKIFERLVDNLGFVPRSETPLRLGVIDAEGKFRQASIERLTRDQRKLIFALELTLSDTTSLVPPNRAVTQWLLHETRNGVELLQMKGNECRAEDVGAAANFIAKAFEKMISSHSPYIRN